MNRGTVAQVATLAVLGLVVAAGIGLITNSIAGDSIGLSAQPLAAGQDLAPAAARGADHREKARERRQDRREERRERARERRQEQRERAREQATTTTVPTTTVPTTTTFEDDGGFEDNSGSGSSDSGSGSDDGFDDD